MNIFLEWVERRNFHEARNYAQGVNLVKKQNGDIIVKYMDSIDPIMFISPSNYGNPEGGSYKISFKSNMSSAPNFDHKTKIPHIGKIILGAITKFLMETKPKELDWGALHMFLRQGLQANLTGRLEIGAESVIRNAVSTANRSLPPEEQYRINGYKIINREAAREQGKYNPKFVSNMKSKQSRYDNDMDKPRQMAQAHQNNNYAQTQAAKNWFDAPPMRAQQGLFRDKVAQQQAYQVSQNKELLARQELRKSRQASPSDSQYS